MEKTSYYKGLTVCLNSSILSEVDGLRKLKTVSQRKVEKLLDDFLSI